jgi:hypothetical protein
MSGGTCEHGWAVEDRCADCFGPYADFGCVVVSRARPGNRR